jgi:hypothetical protein
LRVPHVRSAAVGQVDLQPAVVHTAGMLDRTEKIGVAELAPAATLLVEEVLRSHTGRIGE